MVPKYVVRNIQREDHYISRTKFFEIVDSATGEVAVRAGYDLEDDGSDIWKDGDFRKTDMNSDIDVGLIDTMQKLEEDDLVPNNVLSEFGLLE